MRFALLPYFDDLHCHLSDVLQASLQQTRPKPSYTGPVSGLTIKTLEWNMLSMTQSVKCVNNIYTRTTSLWLRFGIFNSNVELFHIFLVFLLLFEQVNVFWDIPTTRINWPNWPNITLYSDVLHAMFTSSEHLQVANSQKKTQCTSIQTTTLFNVSEKTMKASYSSQFGRVKKSIVNQQPKNIYSKNCFKNSEVAKISTKCSNRIFKQNVCTQV